MVVVYSLPNCSYITAMMRVTSLEKLHGIVRIIGILYAVEILILSLYLVTIKLTLSVSGIRQLAFVLSSQGWLIQPKLIMVTVIVFAFPVAHADSDFTFRFAWLKDND